MENARIDLPAGPTLQPIRSREVRDSVVPTIPVLETAPDVVLRRARLQAHERVGIVVVGRVVLRRKVVRLRLAPASDPFRMLVALVHVMRDGSHVVEELAEEIPSSLARHRVGAEQEIAGGLHRVLQEKPLTLCRPDVTESLIGRRARTVIRIGGGREPALVDAPAMRPTRVEIVGVQPEPAARQHERSRHPRRLQPQNALAGSECFLNVRSLHHAIVPPSHDRPRFGPRDPRPAGHHTTCLPWPAMPRGRPGGVAYCETRRSPRPQRHRAHPPIEHHATGFACSIM